MNYKELMGSMESIYEKHNEDPVYVHAFIDAIIYALAKFDYISDDEALSAYGKNSDLFTERMGEDF